MKSELPYYGISAPQLKALLRPILSDFAPASRAEWEFAVRELWDDATHREERYAALAIARARDAREWVDARSVRLWRHLIVSGAWWDLVDELAAHLVGEALRRDRAEVTPTMLAWSVDDDLWLRRAAVLSQLRHRADTDRDLLHAVIDRNLADGSFWLRKAIGWALREFARTDPEWVRESVARWEGRLAPLARREALKHLG